MHVHRIRHKCAEVVIQNSLDHRLVDLAFLVRNGLVIVFFEHFRDLFGLDQIAHGHLAILWLISRATHDDKFVHFLVLVASLWILHTATVGEDVLMELVL